MTTTHDFGYGYQLGDTYQANGWADYVGAADYQSDTLAEAMAKALYEEQKTQFDARLPEGFFWQPKTSSILGPAARGDELPELDTAVQWLEEISEEICGRYEEIQARVRAELGLTQ